MKKIKYRTSSYEDAERYIDEVKRIDLFIDEIEPDERGMTYEVYELVSGKKYYMSGLNKKCNEFISISRLFELLNKIDDDITVMDILFEDTERMELKNIFHISKKPHPGWLPG